MVVINGINITFQTQNDILAIKFQLKKADFYPFSICKLYMYSHNNVFEFGKKSKMF